MTAAPLDDLSTSIPLSWLLARRELGLTLLVPGRGDPQLWIAHAIEVTDPEEWLRGGELVLTTGIRLPGAEADQHRYVAGLAEHGAAALGFGVGMQFDEVPPAVIEACRSHGLALVEVPLPTPFVAIGRTVSDRLAEVRSRRLQEVLDGQRALTRSALRGGVDALARTLGRLIDAGVLVAGAEANVLARHGAAPPVGQLQAETQGRARGIAVVSPGRSVEFLPVGAQAQHPVGWLGTQRSAPFGSSERLLVQQAAALLALLLVEPATQRTEQIVLLRGLLEGFAPGEVLAGCGLPARAGLRWVAHEDEDWVRRWERQGRSGLHSLADPVRRTPGVAWMSLVGEEDLPRLLESPPRRSGISERLGPENLASGWEQAAEAFDRSGTDGRVLAEEDPATDRAIRQLAGGWVAALSAYDAAQGSKLLPTLTAWLAQHGNADRAAAELGCHRHTLRHRLTRIGDVAGIDLDDVRTRALLALALVPGGSARGGA
mgnify:CR=1 FL=1